MSIEHRSKEAELNQGMGTNYTTIGILNIILCIFIKLMNGWKITKRILEDFGGRERELDGGEE